MAVDSGPIDLGLPPGVGQFISFWAKEFFGGPSGDFERQLGALSPEQQAEFRRIAPTKGELRRLTPIEQGRAEFRALRQAGKYSPPPAGGGSSSGGSSSPPAGVFQDSQLAINAGATAVDNPRSLSTLSNLRRLLVTTVFGAAPKPKLPPKSPPRRSPRRRPKPPAPRPRTPTRPPRVPRVPRVPAEPALPRLPKLPRGAGPLGVLVGSIDSMERSIGVILQRKYAGKGPPTRPRVRSPVLPRVTEKQQLGNLETKGPKTRPRVRPAAPRSPAAPASTLPGKLPSAGNFGRGAPRPYAPSFPEPTFKPGPAPVSPRAPTLPRAPTGIAPALRRLADLSPFVAPFLEPRARPALNPRTSRPPRPVLGPGASPGPSQLVQPFSPGKACECAAPKPRKKPNKNRERKRCVTETKARELGIAKKLGLTRNRSAALR